MTRSRRRVAFSALMTLSLSWLGGACPAQSQQITRVEEDWRVRIVQPDSEITAPQFTAVMVPDGSDESTYFSVEFNHSTSPDFEHGGMQLQVWRDDQFEDSTGRLSENTLGTHDENISWTQYAEVSGTDLTLGVSSFKSSTLDGEFDPETAKVVLYDFGGNLGNYNFNQSLDSSAVGFSGNRVGYMYLIQVRAYSGNQLVQTIDVQQDVKKGRLGGSGGGGE